MRLSETLTGSDGVPILPPCLTWCSIFGVSPDQLAITFTELQFRVTLLCLRRKTGRACWEVRRGLWQESLGPLDAVQALHVRPVTLMALGVLLPLKRHW